MYFRPGGRDEKDKYAYSYLTVQQFLCIKCSGKKISDFFKLHGYNTIAIYGAGELGNLLYEDIKHSDIKINYFIDAEYKKFPNGFNGVEVVGIENIKILPSVDIIVISPIYYCNEIIDNLLLSGCKLEQLINLNDVVYGLE